jgi:Zn-dependent hydrolases, including glyoxylases
VIKITPQKQQQGYFCIKKQMQVKQFEDKNLAHFSYAILSRCESKVVLIDPARNPQPYLDFAKENNAEIYGIIETHPHADFISSHAELHLVTGATIYVSKLVNADYPHQTFDEGDTISFGKIKLTAINTPGHSPDSISILMEHDGEQKAVFTGDTLFIADCGRPDLREAAGHLKAARKELAAQMYHSLHDKLMKLEDDVLIYPAHGAGSLCGRSLSPESSATLGKQKRTNWCLQPSSEEEFVTNLLTDQPFVPAYFPFDVELNKKGAAGFKESVEQVKRRSSFNNFPQSLNEKLLVVDVRDEKEYKQAHLQNSINLMIEGNFETWLGSIFQPYEKFYLTAKDEEQLQSAIERCAVIGYESQIEEAFVFHAGKLKDVKLNLELFKNNPGAYSIIDVRNSSEVKQGKIFPNSIPIPLAELRSRLNEVPTGKPVVVHCAGGYRSAAASSLIKTKLNGQVAVYDLGESVKEF